MPTVRIDTIPILRLAHMSARRNPRRSSPADRLRVTMRRSQSIATM